MELLLMIKQHALNYHEHRYEMLIMLDSIRSLFNLKQKDGESLQDYTKRFKTTRDVLRDRKSTRLNSSHLDLSRMPSSA